MFHHLDPFLEIFILLFPSKGSYGSKVKSKAMSCSRMHNYRGFQIVSVIKLLLLSKPINNYGKSVRIKL